MPGIKSSTDISALLGAAESLKPRDIGGAREVIGSLMSNWPNNRGIYLQLQRLADFITKTRQELSSLRPTEVKQEYIGRATDELDAIVESTASATNRIMDAADVIMDTAGRMAKEDSEKTMAAVNSIFEACTFQDITGQRVTKVVTMLKVIEERIDNMVVSLGELEPLDSGGAVADLVAQMATSQSDIDALMAGDIPAQNLGSVLNGPALPGQAPTQADIDRILAGEM